MTDETETKPRRTKFIDEVTNGVMEKLEPWLNKLETLVTAEIPEPEVKRTEIQQSTTPEVKTETETPTPAPEVAEIQSSVNTQVQKVRRGLGILF